MHWSLSGRRPARGRGVPTHDAAQVAAVLAACDDNRRPGHARGGRSGVSGASVPVFGGVVLDLTGMRVVDVDDDVGRRRGAAGTFGPDLEAELRQRRPDRRPLPAELRHRNGGRMGGLPRRRPVQDPLREDRGNGRRARGRAGRRHRRCAPAAAPGRRSGRISRSCSSAARAPSASSPGSGCAPIPCRRRTRAAYSFTDFEIGHRSMPADPATRRNAGRAAALRRRRDARSHGGDGTTACCWCSTRATGMVEATMRCGRGRVRGGDSRSTTSSSPSGSRTATTLACRPDPQGFRRRHDGDRRAVVAAPTIFTAATAR